MANPLPSKNGRRILDLFCGAGGCSEGYRRAGFEVVGVDIKTQPNYPFEFFQDDALKVLDWLLDPVGTGFYYGAFDAVHASPPCQEDSAGRVLPGAKVHERLLVPVRDRLAALGLPYVIENVVGADMPGAVLLCGAAFGLEADGHDLARHRLFECSFPVMVPPCAHGGRPVLGLYGQRAKTSRGVTLTERTSRWGRPASLAVGSEAMGVDWMTWNELTQAIPPAYTEHIGGYLLNALEVADAA